ncbi:hypothetical protein [Streptomyces sp. GbtcB6]|uniref:hypothetical protein n=1 Tax=Streptomyces sp. GbtcB6 TaxID=2824751 RepID=UPI001C303C9B|nr:hypothetical protein [Streptomyces sp. GbtcB6]
MTNAEQPSPTEPLRSFAVAQDGTLHFIVRARDLDHARAQLADVQAGEAGTDVSLGDSVRLAHITLTEDPALPPTVGSQMVIDALGTSPQGLGRRHTGDSAEDVVARLVVVAARHLDHVSEQLTYAAQSAASTLTRVATGKTSINSLGVLQNSATQIDILAARHADAIERLTAVIHAYRQVTAPDDFTAQPAHHPGQAPTRPAAPSAPANHSSRRR